jgi:plastocyanin
MKTIAKTLPLLFLFACGGGGGTADDVQDPDAAESADVQEVSCTGATIAATFTTSGFAYSPMSDTIAVGEIVQFMPGSGHDVASGNPGSPDGLFSVGLAGNGCFQFNTAGTYPFHCTPHQFAGSLTVQ